MNVAAHLLSGLLIFEILRRILGTTRGFCVALLWTVHPLTTSAVTYIVQRAESLMSFFYLLALYGLVRSAEFQRKILWSWVSIAAFILGVGCKEVMFTVPLVMLLFDRAFLAGSFWVALRERKFLYGGLLAALLGVGGWMWMISRSMVDPTAGFGFKGIPPLQYLGTQPGAILYYLRLAVWPHPLVLDYGWPLVKSTQEVLLPGIIVIALLAATVWACVKKPKIGFLGAWFFLILFPTSSFIPVADAFFEHRMYLPLVAVIAGAVLGLERLAADGAKKYLAALCVGVAVIFGTLTVLRNSDYHDEEGIWRKAYRYRPDNARILDNLGFLLTEKKGRFDEALEFYLRAIQLNPTFEGYHNSVGIVLSKLGRYEDAIRYYQNVLALNPDSEIAHHNWGLALKKLGKPDGAMAHFEEAVRLKPDSAEYYFSIAELLRSENKREQAIGYLETAVRVRPHFAEGYIMLGILYHEMGVMDKAIEYYETAIKSNPFNWEAYNNMGTALAEGGYYDEAEAYYRQALALKPDYQGAKNNLEMLQDMKKQKAKKVHP